MVIVFDPKPALTPAGKPVAAPIPVAPVVACVILVRAVLIHKVGVLLAAPTVLTVATVMVMALDVTGEPVKQVCAGSFVITQVTTFPLTRLDVVKVELLVPTGVLPTFQA
jgi:hypothetical protein